MIFINGTGKIHTSFVSPETGTMIPATSPDYASLIPPAQLRRMSRMIKMGLWAGIQALKDAQVEVPEAIITATALGCNEDTEKFLASFQEDEQGIGSPTPFIQSTHNTIGGQLALMLSCTGYNMTYTQRGHSFISALQDACLLLTEDTSTVLCGSIEEITPLTVNLFRRMGYFRQGNTLSEGSGFLLLSNQPGPNCYGQISTILFEKENMHVFLEQCIQLLQGKNTSAERTCLSGISENDPLYTALQKTNICFRGNDFTKNEAALPLKDVMQLIYAAEFLSSPAAGNINQWIIISHENHSNFRLIFVEKVHKS